MRDDILGGTGRGRSRATREPWLRSGNDVQAEGRTAGADQEDQESSHVHAQGAVFLRQRGERETSQRRDVHACE